jgi:hypothetical protein
MFIDETCTLALPDLREEMAQQPSNTTLVQHVHNHFTPLEIFVEPQVDPMSENSSMNEPVTHANDMERDVDIPFPENDIQSEDELISYVLK